MAEEKTRWMEFMLTIVVEMSGVYAFSARDTANRLTGELQAELKPHPSDLRGRLASSIGETSPDAKLLLGLVWLTHGVYFAAISVGLSGGDLRFGIRKVGSLASLSSIVPQFGDG
jgi:hypothetical protein